MMQRRDNSKTTTFVAKVGPGSPEYKEQVAQPIMEAIDALPVEYRQAIHDIGYVPVYFAYKQGWSVDRIRRAAADRTLPHLG